MDDEAIFRRDLIALLPDLTAWACSLARDRDEAGDLVQDTMVNALRYRGHFQPGTNLRGWTFRILRNLFIGGRRLRWRETRLDRPTEDGLTQIGDQQAVLDLDDLRLALGGLTEEKRQALLQIGVAGLSYEDAAAVCDCPVGTMKSRVARARAELREALALGYAPRDGVRPHLAWSVLAHAAEQAPRARTI